MPKIPNDVVRQPQKTTPLSRDTSKLSPIITVKEEGEEFILEFNDAALEMVRDEHRKQTGKPKARLTDKILHDFAIKALTDYIAENQKEEKPTKPKKSPRKKSTESPKTTDV